MKKLYYTFAYLILLGLPASVLTYLIRDKIDFNSVILVILIAIVVGGVFEIWAVKQHKNDKFFIWEYNAKSILGFKLLGVPLEDFVFFLVLTPIFIISIYEAIKNIILTNKELLFIMISCIVVMIGSYIFVYKHAIKPKK